jgi:hypothetical protein
VDAIRNFAGRAIAAQSEFSEKLVEANKHWLEQMQTESTAAVELFRKVNGTMSPAERIASIQEWVKGVTERAAKDAAFAFETAQALGKIELKLFTRQPEGDKAEDAA